MLPLQTCLALPPAKGDRSRGRPVSAVVRRNHLGPANVSKHTLESYETFPRRPFSVFTRAGLLLLNTVQMAIRGRLHPNDDRNSITVWERSRIMEVFLDFDARWRTAAAAMRSTAP